MNAFLNGLTIILFFSIMTLSASAQATALKIGFVDSETIIQQLPEFKSIEAQLTGARKGFEDSLRVMQTEFQTKLDAYQKQQGLMNAETKAQEEAKLGAIRDRFLQYQQETMGAQGAYAQLQQRLLQPIKEKVTAAIEKVAKDEKISAVMETGLTIYYDKKLDITFNVLAYLRRAEK